MIDLTAKEAEALLDRPFAGITLGKHRKPALVDVPTLDQIKKG